MSPLHTFGEPSSADWLLLVVSLAMPVFAWMLVRRNWHRRSDSNSFGDHYVEPELVLVSAVFATTIPIMVVAYILGIRDVAPFDALMTVSVVPVLAVLFLLWTPMALFRRPRLLIPAWRRAEMRQERDARRARRRRRAARVRNWLLG